jgi:hypothetical protein
MDKEISNALLAFWRFIWRFLFLITCFFPFPTHFQSHLNLTIEYRHI